MKRKRGEVRCKGKEGDHDGWEIVDKGSSLSVDKGQQTKSVAKYSVFPLFYLKQIMTKDFSARWGTESPGRSVEPINLERAS